MATARPYIANQDVLEADAVRRLHAEVGGEQGRDEGRGQPGRGGRCEDAEDAEDASDRVGDRYGDLCGGGRAVPLGRVGAVPVGVAGVVDQVIAVAGGAIAYAPSAPKATAAAVAVTVAVAEAAWEPGKECRPRMRTRGSACGGRGRRTTLSPPC